jgi:predicted ATPase
MTQRLNQRLRRRLRAVFTGGPSVGKTTCLGLAQRLGCQIVPELATQVIKEGKFLPWIDHIAFQWQVLKLQIAAEQQLVDSDCPVILDRGVYDAIAYRLVNGRQLQGFLQRLQPQRYDVAFVFSPLTDIWEDDGIRYEDPHFAREITPCLIKVYQAQGIPVVVVPQGTPEERMAFVLRHLDWSPEFSAFEPARASSRSAQYSPLSVSETAFEEAEPLLATI